MRKTAALFLTVGLMASLAACSSTDADDVAAVDCTPTASGTASDSVTATGDFNTKPTVELATPVSSDTTERSVLIEGDGLVAADGYDVTVEYTMFNGTTGDEIDATTYDGTAAVQFPLDGTLIAGLTKTLECSAEGSRVVGVTAPDDGLNASALETYGLTETDSLVIVADVVTVTEPEEVDPALTKADGEDQELPADFPAIGVSIADDETGTPTLTIPATDPPTELKIATLKKGDGEEIAAGDDVVVNYTGVIWGTGVEFDSSWTSGATATFNTANVITGFGDAIVGQTIGSQVLVVIPPAEGYGDTGNDSAGISGTDTLVFIVDILGLG